MDLKQTNTEGWMWIKEVLLKCLFRPKRFIFSKQIDHTAQKYSGHDVVAQNRCEVPSSQNLTVCKTKADGSVSLLMTGQILSILCSQYSMVYELF